MASDLDGLNLSPETRRILSSANLKTFNAVFVTTDLELYRLFRNDISMVREVREVVAREMVRLGHCRPFPGQRMTWHPDRALQMAIFDENDRAREAKRQANRAILESERMERRAAERSESSKRVAVAADVVAALEAEFDRFEFSTRTAGCLKNERLLTIEAIARASDQELLRIPNFGKVSLREVRAIVPAAEMPGAKPRVRVKAGIAPYYAPANGKAASQATQ